MRTIKNINSTASRITRTSPDLCNPCRSVHSGHFSRGKALQRLEPQLPRVRISTGQRSFAVFGPATWNSLPPSLRASELSLSTFKRLLKTQLFQHAWTIVQRRCDWTASSAPHTNIRIQLNSLNSINFLTHLVSLLRCNLFYSHLFSHC